MNIDMEEILEETFKNDRIRKEIKINHLEQYLYTDKILSLHPETTYSTVEAGRIIGRRDSTLRNYFRTDLVDYIQPEKAGIYYRLDYKSVFKLHMILLLVEKANKTTADIAFYCGLSSLVSTSSNTINETPSTVDYSEIETDITNLKQWMILESMNSNIMREKNKLLETKLSLSNINNEINQLNKDIELLHIKQHNENVEDKYYRMLDYSLKHTMAKNKEKSQWTLMNLFRGRDFVSEDDIDQVLQESIKMAEENRKEHNKTIIEDIKAKLDNKINEKKNILIEIEDLEGKIEGMNYKLKELQNNPHEIKTNELLN